MQIAVVGAEEGRCTMRRKEHAVRYYIDRNDQGAEVRSVPVSVRATGRPAPATRELDAAQDSARLDGSDIKAGKGDSRVTRLVRSAVRRTPAGKRP